MAHGEVLNPDTDKRVKKNQDTLTLLRQAAGIDCTWAECAFYAKISEKTLYEWFNDGEDGAKLREELEALRNKPVLLARQTVANKISESYSNAMDYLSRKRKDEFSGRQELTGAGGRDLIPQQEEKEAAQEAITAYLYDGQTDINRE